MLNLPQHAAVAALLHLPEQAVEAALLNPPKRAVDAALLNLPEQWWLYHPLLAIFVRLWLCWSQMQGGAL